MRIEWDPNKAASNVRDHGIDFADAAVALEDENALTIEDTYHDEQRFKTLCLGSNLNVLLVVHAEQDRETIRIISARKADRNESKQYFEGLSHE